MVNKYLKALILTIVLLALGLWLMNSIEERRIAAVARELEELSLDADQTQQLLFYETVFGSNAEICPVLSGLIGAQEEKTKDVLAKFEAVNASGASLDVRTLRRKYLNENVRLYLFVEKYRQECNDTNRTSVLYFFTEKTFNPDEAAQQKVLDSIVNDCPHVRVFALPHDEGIPVADVIISKYGIASYPSLVINGEKITGLRAKGELVGKLGCGIGDANITRERLFDQPSA